MNKPTRWILLLITVALTAGAAFFLLPRQQAPESPSPDITADQTPPAAEDQPLMRHPVPESAGDGEQDSGPLPALHDSDASWQQALGRLIDPDRLGELFLPKDMITRLVVTIDNLPRAKLPIKTLPTLPVAGKFLVTERAGAGMEINPDNDNRYEIYVDMLEGVDSRRLAAVYFRFYPLFQEAYSELGYKSAYFNDRLITVIDDLLDAPDITGPIKLVQPAVFYKYADPKLEALSAGQKLMIRIGPANAARVKAKLRELRQALIMRGSANS